MNAYRLRCKLRDETDPPGLPPYITRSTRPQERIASSPTAMKLHQILTKHWQGMLHNFGGGK